MLTSAGKPPPIDYILQKSMPTNENKIPNHPDTSSTAIMVCSSNEPINNAENQPYADVFAQDMHQIPKRVLDDQPSHMNMDLLSFVRVMRGNRDEIDTDAMDITLDPFASAFLWRNLNSPDFRHFPDLKRLANQLVNHINRMYDRMTMSTDKTFTDEDMQFIRNVTGFDYYYRDSRANHYPVNKQQEGFDIHQNVLNTHPTHVYINQSSIYSKSIMPQHTSDFQRASEEFALNDPRPSTRPSAPTNQELVASSKMVQHFEPNATSIHMTSTPNQPIWRTAASPMEPTPGQPAPLYSRILQRNLANTNTKNNGAATLHPQTMLFATPGFPSVYPDMTAPSSLVSLFSRNGYQQYATNHYF